MRQPRRRLVEPRLARRFRRSSPPTPTHWWSDPPKLTPIVISLIAVTISCLSWYESHRGRMINEEINRPILSLSSIEIESAVYSMPFRDYEDRVILFFTAKVKNVGKSTAVVRRTEITPTFFRESPGTGCKIIPEIDRITNYNQEKEPILAGAEEEYVGDIQLTLACEQKSSWDFKVEALIDYGDVATGHTYSQTLSKRIEVSPAEEKMKREKRLKL